MNGLREMIYIIGKGRLLKLFVLIAINAAMCAAIYLHLEPEAIRIESEVKTVTNDTIRLRREINAMPDLLAEYMVNEKEYKPILASGFVGEQDRIIARKLVNYFRGKSNVNNVEYEFGPLVHFKEDYRTKSFPDEVVQSELKLTVKSTLDLEAFAFMQYLEETLPGMLVLRNITMERSDMALSKGSLMAIGNGEKVNLIDTSLGYEWVTLSLRPDRLKSW